MLAQTPVVILCGGLGTRLQPVLADVPKGLAPCGDKPFLEIQLELLRDQGARRFVLCIGHLAEQIQRAFGDGRRWGVHIDYSVEGEHLLGTGGALKLAERAFQPRALVLNGDTYLAADYAGLLRHHLDARRLSGALATVALAKADDATRFGTVLLDEARRYLSGFREKDASATGGGWLNAGAYVLERGLLDFMRPGIPASIERDVFPAVLQAGRKIAAFPCAEAFYDIGTPGDWQRFVQLYERQRAA
jgi:NDP-sugar pyrophosphorylase family protein